MSAARGVVLIGGRGVGKTSVAARLAQRLDWPLVELDERIEDRAGRAIADIFGGAGEDHFRDLEAAELARLRPQPPQVVSVGGGCVLRADNRAQLRALGVVCWLTAEVETLRARLQADVRRVRPSLTGADPVAEVADVLAQRAPLYRATADHEVDTTRRTIDEVAEEVIRVAGLRRADGAR